MKKLGTAFLVCTLLGVGVAAAQISMPRPGSPGSSPDSAVRMIVTSDLMVDRFIKRWLRTHYSGWDADPHEFTEIGMERYAVVFVTKQGESGRRVYFRVKSRMNDPHDDQDGAFPF